MMSFELVRKNVGEALKELDIDCQDFNVEFPADLKFGDYSSNVSLILSKKLGKSPREIGQLIVEKLESKKSGNFSKIEIAGAGFINFFLSEKYINQKLNEILENEGFGKNDLYKGQKIMVEYTDPNPFKVFHIGHLMSNAIGEAISRLIENIGAEVIRACWQGDVGLHVAKAIWGMREKINSSTDEKKLNIKDLGVKDWGDAYVLGSQKYEDDESIKKEIDLLNKIIFDKSDKEVNVIYDIGRKVSLEHFEEIYKKLGTKFDHYFFEGIEGRDGVKIVEDNLGKVFERSDGAVVFKGESYGLHTRVFINSVGLPTYETKELGLNQAKFKKEKDLSRSIIITGNEQNDYFKVLLKVLELVLPEIGKKTEHIGHGMLQFATGKMSSRKGNVITGESLIEQVEEMVGEKIKDSDFDDAERQKIKTAVAVGAIKYSILKQSIGGNIIYDFEKSVSFEGDSGPYLQYAYTRAFSVLEKAKKVFGPSSGELVSDNVKEFNLALDLQKKICQFDEIALRSSKELAPHYLVTYLTQLASLFNGFYANNKIVDEENKEESLLRLKLVKAFALVMKNGLNILAIPVLEKM